MEIEAGGGRRYGEGQIPPMGEGGRIPSIFEIPRNTEVESGAAEQQTATYQRGNSTQEGTRWQQGQTTEKFSGPAYKMKCSWGKPS